MSTAQSANRSDSIPDVQSPQQQRWGPGARVGIIGGLGEMGKLFAKFFRERHYSVAVADLGTARNNREVLQAADIVVFSVPLHETVAIIDELVPYVEPRHLLMDVSSLKVAPVHAMLRSPAAVVGLHPMFGGRIHSLSGQTLVACPVRIGAVDWQQIREMFLNAGMRVKECSPEEHDRMMSIIQVLFHVTTMLMGRVLRDLEVDINETLEYTSPSYRLEMSLVGRMFAQSGVLYSAITEMNPNTGSILALLRQGLDCYEKWYRDGDFSSFVSDFQQSARHLGEFCTRGYQESSAILDFVIQLADQREKGISDQ